MLGGFDNYAHLRQRDHRPSLGRYELTPGFGPKSSSSKRSIFSRHYPPIDGESCSVGPGAYVIPTTIGTGRSTRFVPHSSDLSGPAAKAAVGQSSSERTLPSIINPKQYSMALYPDTPAYSISTRLKSEWEQKSAHASPGPAAYDVPGYFDMLDPKQQQLHQSSGPAPGVHFGIRTVLPEAREKEGVPGPGTYQLERFGDNVPCSRVPLATRSSRRGCDANTPGPGAYDDPTSIAYCADRVRMRRRFTKSTTFGSRWPGREYHTVGPGPAAYSILTATKLIERNKRHAPKFLKSKPKLDHQSVEEASAARTKRRLVREGVPQIFPTLPSEFDFDFRKGKTFGARLHESSVQPVPLSMAQTLDTKPSGSRPFWESPPPPGGRFAPTSLDSNARAAAEKAKSGAGHPSVVVNSAPGPGAYNVEMGLTVRRAPASLFGRMLSAKSVSAENGVPGPGHYRMVDDADTRNTIFYKGDFHPRGALGQGGSAAEDLGIGPGEHYNDDTMYSRSINGDRIANKGYTMGIRYPARAVYQHCRPYDETTNINCVYDHELTWEVHPRQKLSPVQSRKQ
ncbi:hypothetical protein JKF63_01045 [Porcisia hertigi]|uniref:Sperm-tail PG-rich repeat-containing protein 2 n=1 Tax=Porcisia hertigi TaxID=2761500 RepID=A0A836HTY7_9TRYP|nr:hypothetical protein JKF63_01045 [Porcisia hertigi]